MSDRAELEGMMKLLVFCSLMLSLTTMVCAADVSGPVVSVTGGKIQGRVLTAPGGAVFKGVPFAAPPVGELRWRVPAPVVPWQGVRDAGAFGPSCVQEIRDWNRVEATGSKEDCLTLNVWTSEWPAKTKKPVMLWMFGGGNTGGGPNVDYFDGASLSRKGVILVSINYRLGVFGFMAHPALTTESAHHSSGNYGLHDQLAALKWVHENIASFGGDPDNVTVFGQSAGGGDLAYMMSSPLSRGLIHKAIQQSSSAGVRSFPTLADAEKTGEQLAAKMQAPADKDGIKYLRGLSAEQLQKASVAAASELGRINLGLAIVDGWYLPANARQTFAAGKQHSIPLIIGSMARETGPPKADALRKAVTDAYGINAEKALTFYGLDVPGDGKSDPLYGSAAQQYQSEAGLPERCGTIQEAIWFTAANSPVYQYQIDRAIPGQDGTHHSGDLPYVFGNLLPVAQNNLGGSYTETDRKISNEIQTYWTNFAKTGNPNGTGLPNWPKFEPGARPFIEFTDNGPVANAGLRREICDLFMENLQHQMKTTGR